MAVSEVLTVNLLKCNKDKDDFLHYSTVLVTSFEQLLNECMCLLLN